MADRADYQAVLADLRAKRQEIDITIAALERFLAGMGGATIAITPPPTPKFFGGGQPQTPKPYKGLTIKQAAIKYLEEVRLKQTSKQIAEVIGKGGVINKSKDFTNTVRTTMSRESEFVKVGNEWALKSWYPSDDQTSTPEKTSTAH